MKIVRSFIFLLVILISTVPYAKAQPGDPGGGTNPTVPITGIEILIGLGGLFGVKKLLDSKKKK